MIYVPLAVDRLELGQALPVDVWAPDGRLLLRKGQPIRSEQDREMLQAHQAGMTQSDAQAWHKSYERLIQTLRAGGAAPDVIAHAALPAEILETDYQPDHEVTGGWLDLQEMLSGLLHQGEGARQAPQRLAGIERRALQLLQGDPDQGLFILFQALEDPTLGYCATHALLSAATCELTANKLGMAPDARNTLFRAALLMNIGMAQDQDRLATQSSALIEPQRRLIREHAHHSCEILQQLGFLDAELLDLVRWHHDLDESDALAPNWLSRRLLRMADSFVAKMAPRKTRLAMSALSAARSLVLDATEDMAKLGSAMATVIGFYPPGSYVQLLNGERAVVAARGAQANQPHVVSIVNAGGMPLSPYRYRDTADPHFAVRAPVNAEKIKVTVSLDKVMKARQEHSA